MHDYQKFVDVGDNHGDEVNQDVTASLFAFMADFKPDLAIHGGDNWNFNYLRKGASPKEEDASADGDWQMGSEFFLEYFSYGRRRVFLRGNHDERLYDTYRFATKEAVRRGAKSGIEDIEKLVKKRKVKMLPYNSRTGVLDLDGLRCIHGYACGVSAARKFAASYGTCIYHHTHATDVGAFERYPEPALAYGTGCLMHVDQEYNSRQMNKLRHENAWCYGWIKNGKATIFQARRGADGKYILPHEVKAY